MKRLYLLLQFLLLVSVCSYAQHLSFDSKYVKVGVMSNEWPDDLARNPNLRNLGTLPGSTFDESHIGKQILDILFQRDANGLHMDRLYDEALQNTTIEELEVALKDESAETKDILKREVANQLLKNNYIVIFSTNEKNKKNGLKIKKYWSVYHVEIDDRIIEQAYSNWRTPELYDQIQVPVKLVAQGKVHKKIKLVEQQINNVLSKMPVFDVDDRKLMYDIAKKVPAFAIRGPVASRFPFVARMGRNIGAKKTGRIYIYRLTENDKGESYSKKVCTARATEVSSDSTRMYMISGRFPSTKKGDVAVLKDRHRSSVSLLSQGSFGNDSRIGGRLQYEYLLDFSKHGIAHYLLGAVGYNRHDKEPDGIWWGETNTVQPVLNNANVSLGYGMGFNFFGRMELIPYLTFGYQQTFVTGNEDSVRYWDNDDESWPRIDNTDLTPYFSFIGSAGASLNVNIWYPLQLSLGADYNMSIPAAKSNPLLSNHITNRLNLYAGLRLHF